MPVPRDETEIRRLLEPHAAYGADGMPCVGREAVASLAQALGLTVKETMIVLLDMDIWPERFRRNQGVFSAKQMARLLSRRVFIAGCGGLGGHVASLLARMGVGGFRLCDPDIFEESNLNRQYFCTEKTLGKPKALVSRDGLLDIASYLDVDAHVIAAAPDNLPTLLQGMDAAIDCLDSVPRKKMLEEAAHTARIPFLHGSVLRDEGFAFLSTSSIQLAAMYPLIPAGTDSSAGQNTAGTAAVGTACLMASLLGKGLASESPKDSPLFHLDYSVPEMERFCLEIP